MIENYEIDAVRATHIIRITLMRREYVGHISFEIGGNCRGASVLEMAIDFFSECYIDSIVDNDCYIDYDEEFDLYTAILRNKNGETVQVSGDDSEMKDMIVSIEIEEVMPDE